MSGFHRPGRHCSHQALRSAVRCRASGIKERLHLFDSCLNSFDHSPRFSFETDHRAYSQQRHPPKIGRSLRTFFFFSVHVPGITEQNACDGRGIYIACEISENFLRLLAQGAIYAFNQNTDLDKIGRGDPTNDPMVLRRCMIKGMVCCEELGWVGLGWVGLGFSCSLFPTQQQNPPTLRRN